MASLVNISLPNPPLSLSLPGGHKPKVARGWVSTLLLLFFLVYSLVSFLFYSVYLVFRCFVSMYFTHELRTVFAI